MVKSMIMQLVVVLVTIVVIMVVYEITRYISRKAQCDRNIVALQKIGTKLSITLSCKDDLIGNASIAQAKLEAVRPFKVQCEATAEEVVALPWVFTLMTGLYNELGGLIPREFRGWTDVRIANLKCQADFVDLNFLQRVESLVKRITDNFNAINKDRMLVTHWLSALRTALATLDETALASSVEEDRKGHYEFILEANKVLVATEVAAQQPEVGWTMLKEKLWLTVQGIRNRQMAMAQRRFAVLDLPANSTKPESVIDEALKDLESVV